MQRIPKLTTAERVVFQTLPIAPRAFLAIVPLILLACGNTSGSARELAWTEQVEISPGEHVSVERHVRFTVSRTWGEKTSGIDQILESKIVVRHEGSALTSFDAMRMLPLLLTKDPANKELLLVVSTDDCLTWARNDKPDPAYWTFRLHGDKWYRSELPRSVVGHASNLLTDIRATDEGTLNAQQVAIRKTGAAAAHGRFATIKSDRAIQNCGNVGASAAKGDFENLEKR